MLIITGRGDSDGCIVLTINRQRVKIPSELKNLDKFYDETIWTIIIAFRGNNDTRNEEKTHFCKT